MLCTRVDRNRAPHTLRRSVGVFGSRVRCLEVGVVCGRGSDVQSVVLTEELAVAFLELTKSIGCTHFSKNMEPRRKVWTIWRTLLLSDEERNDPESQRALICASSCGSWNMIRSFLAGISRVVCPDMDAMPCLIFSDGGTEVGPKRWVIDGTSFRGGGTE